MLMHWIIFYVPGSSRIIILLLSGGNENGKYRLSAGYLDNQGIVKESGFKKYSTNLTSSFKFLESKKLGLDINLIAAHTQTQIAPISNDAGFQGSLIGTALQWNPTIRYINLI